MPPTLAASERLIRCTVRIECDTPDGPSLGTGFFYGFFDDGEGNVPVVVTNRHVVHGASRGVFHLTGHAADGGSAPGRHLRIELDGFEGRWIGHPDPSVDLCVMLVGPLVKEAVAAGHRFSFIWLNKSLLPTPAELAELTALEDIIMIGYPNGIWDSVNNMPITRRGVTATHPSIDYEGRREFMIDAACFPGSSGSPVFLFNPGGWTSRDGSFHLGRERIRLLGVLYAAPEYTATGEIKIVDVPTARQAVAVSLIPNLGFVIKSCRLDDFEAVLRPMVGQSATAPTP